MSNRYPSGLLLNMYGFTRQTDGKYFLGDTSAKEYATCQVTDRSTYILTAVFPFSSRSVVCRTPKQLVRYLDSWLSYKPSCVLGGKSSRDLSKDLVRVKSSNIWSIGIHIKRRGDSTGDVIVQFKDAKGGPGDIYRLYDVPIKLYRQWVTAPSKGHFYWKYLRNDYLYSKLTGDKRGKLKNAVN